MDKVQLITFITLAVFSIMMISIGIYSTKKTKSMDGFLLGGRNIGPWISAFAYGTTYFSAVIFVGFAGKLGWEIGYGALWIGFFNAFIGCFLAWKVLAKRTRSMTHKLNVRTMPEFFEARYGMPAMKFIAALVIFIFLVPYSAAVYQGLGSMLSVVFPGFDIKIIMLLIAVITAVFLVLGGYVATVYTDFVQGLIMIGGVLIMIGVVVFSTKVGGVVAAYDKLKEIEPSLVHPFGGDSLKFLCFNILLTSLGTWGLPQMINKFYAVKDVASIRKATIVSTIFAAIISIGAYYVGTMGRIVLDNELPTKGNGYDYIVPNLLNTVLGGTNTLTIILLAIILVLLLSASMSTLSALVLTSASAISVDLLPFISKSVSNFRQMTITRILCIIFVTLSYIFAIAEISFIVSIMSFSWGIVAGTFIGPYIWGLYGRFITKAGALSGMICGFSTVAVSIIIATAVSPNGFKGAVNNAMYFGVAAMFVSLVTVPVVSLFTSKFKVPDSITTLAFSELGGRK